MARVISFCSSRGGTGKTTIATNLAFFLAKSGVDTVAIDMDFRAPSFYYIFKTFIDKPLKQYFNDFLDSQCELQDTLYDLGDKLETKGRLLVSFSDPSLTAIELMTGRGKHWEAKALRNIFRIGRSLNKDLSNPTIIYDNGPGIHYSSLNAIVASDTIVFISTPDDLDIQGVVSLFKEYMDVFENKVMVAFNKVFPVREEWPVYVRERFTNQLPAIVIF